MKVKNTIKLLILTGLLIFSLSACFIMPEEAPVLPPPILSMPQPPYFVTVPVARGAVRDMSSPMAVYIPSMEERLMFTQLDVPVLGIYVTVGDEVQAGDVIASLHMPAIQQELEGLNRRRERLEFDFTQVVQSHNLALNLAEVSGTPVDDSRFLSQRIELLDEMRTLDTRIQYLERRDSVRYLVATMDGTVSQATPFVDGMRSRSGQVIATITDNTYSAFVVRSHVAVHMNIGDRFDMNIGPVTHLMEVVDPVDIGFPPAIENHPEAFLVFVDVPPALRPGARGNVHVIFDEVEDALYIPRAALRRSVYRTFVYVLEGDLRVLRDVVIGIEGTTVVEIIEGVYEGELIIWR